MGRRPIDKESLKGRVLDTAEKSVQQIGLARSSMSDLVRASGVSRRTFYKVFRSKEDIIKGVVDRKIQSVLEKVGSVMGGKATTGEKMEAMITIAQGITSFVTPTLMREIAAEHPRVWEHINARRMKVIDIWRQLMLEGQRKGEIRRGIDPEIFMLMVTTVAQHMVNPTFLTEHGLTLGQVLGQFKVIMLHGVIAREVSS